MSITTSNTALRVFRDSGAPEDNTDYTTLVVVHGWGWKACEYTPWHLSYCEVSLFSYSSIQEALFRGQAVECAHRLRRPSRLSRRGELHCGGASRAPTSSQHAKVAGHGSRNGRFHEETRSRCVSLPCRLHRASADSSCAGQQRRNHPCGMVHGCRLRHCTPSSCWFVPCEEHLSERLSQACCDVRCVPLVSFVVGAEVDECSSRLTDVSNIFFGYGTPTNVELYHPLHDPTLNGAEKLTAFDHWVTSYFEHGDVMVKGAEALQSHVSRDVQPTSTLSRLTPEEIAELTYPPATFPTSSDFLSMIAGVMHGTYAATKEHAFYPPEGVEDLRSVCLRIVWCDRSFWETPWSAYLLSKELAQARNEGKHMRDIELVRLTGSNHFVSHWFSMTPHGIVSAADTCSPITVRLIGTRPRRSSRPSWVATRS